MYVHIYTQTLVFITGYGGWNMMVKSWARRVENRQPDNSKIVNLHKIP